MQKFKSTYIDKYGIEESFFISDGSSLKITLRNIEFYGQSFNLLKPKESEYDVSKEIFDLNDYNELVKYVLHVTIQIKIKYNDKIEIGYLNFTTDCSDSNDYYIFKNIELVYKDEIHYLRNVVTEVFEYVLIHLQKSLPKHIYIVSCISCKYGNYNPSGQLEFGGMSCFKKFKEESKLIIDKESYFDITENKEILNVQETHLCAEYEELSLNDWNYNDWKHTLSKK